MLVSMIKARVEPDVIADVRFMEEDQRLVIVLDGSLGRREVAAAVLTDLVATISGPADLVDEIREVADVMAWNVRVEEDGDGSVLTVS
jgi:hypothetical protein